MINSREEFITRMLRIVRINGPLSQIYSESFDLFSAESENFVNPGRKPWAPDV
jgi:hypothetical protein